MENILKTISDELGIKLWQAEAAAELIDSGCTIPFIARYRKEALLERLTKSMLALNVEGEAGTEVLEQMHRPQNALLHQKMQEQVISGVVPLVAKLVEEGNETGLFSTKYPADAAEMIIIYSNIAFDELAGLSPAEMKKKSRAFIYHTERILGAKEGSLNRSIMKIFAG